MKTTLTILVASLLFLCASAGAQTDIYLKGAVKLIPIGVPQLCLQTGGDSTAPRDLPRVLSRDLDLSGYFKVISSEAYVEQSGKCAGPDGFAYSDWSVIGADGLVRGIVRVEGGLVKVQMYLHDVPRQKVVLGKEYEGDITQVPRMAHRFANEIMKYFTGEPGIFGSQLSFSGKIGRFKELFAMDLDGSNLRQLTSDRSISVSSSWDPSGNNIIFTSYRSRMPELFTVDAATRKVRQFSPSGAALEIGAKYSHDGGSVLASVSSGRESDIALFSMAGALLRKLTPPNGAIDVSPDWSPDGSKIVFCSDRAGGPQIYVMNADGSNPHRISFVTSNYCTSPDWSPKGDKIVYVCRVDGTFQMFISDPDGGGAQQLTSVGDNEDPDFAPNGRYIAFSTTFGRPGIPSLAMMRVDGSSTRQLTQSRGGDSEPAWSPIVP